MILHIHTEQAHVLKMKIIDGENTDQYEFPSETAKAQDILPYIEDVLHMKQRKMTDITEIFCSTGPGSYTGLRVGAVIAQTISLILNIPINGKKPGTMPELEYGKDSMNIYKMKK